MNISSKRELQIFSFPATSVRVLVPLPFPSLVATPANAFYNQYQYDVLHQLSEASQATFDKRCELRAFMFMVVESFSPSTMRVGSIRILDYLLYGI